MIQGVLHRQLSTNVRVNAISSSMLYLCCISLGRLPFGLFFVALIERDEILWDYNHRHVCVTSRWDLGLGDHLG